MNKLAYFLLGSVLLVFLALVMLCQSGHNEVKTDQLAANATAEDTTQVEPEQLFGFVRDSFDIHAGTIKRNQFLADILLKHHVPYAQIDALARKSKTVFDVRQIRFGKKYTVLCSQDSSARAQYFVYQPNQVDFVVYDLRDTLSIYKGQKEVTVEVREASGIIYTSLFETLAEQQVNTQLALDLANIYAWSIDFYRIQKGDYFKTIYEVKLVDGEPVGLGRVQASLFHHSGADHFAFHFDNTQGEDYFDETGRSLRKAFLQSPLKFGRLTSGYTRKRFHPVQKRWKAHLGTDYAAPKGTPILAVGDGVVTEARYKRFNGNYVKIRHNGTYSTQYLHMSKIGSGIKPGASVRQGDVIGYVGSTGLATGPHVCFRFWKNGKQVDHRKEKMPPSKPIAKEMREAYMRFMEEQRKKLEMIALPGDQTQQPVQASLGG